MIRQALQASRARQVLGVAGPIQLPAPVGGWNTRDSIAGLPPEYATVLDNWFPRVGECVQRGGSQSFATAMTGAIKSFAQYKPATGTNKLFGVTNAGLYDITAGGVIGGVSKALTNGYLSSVNITNSAGNSFLWVCNGTDTPTYWDGATWTNATITGIGTPANLTCAWLFGHRIFAIEKNSMNVWYLPLDSIQGAANKLPFGNLMRRGGYLVAGTAWTLDSGAGPDDLFTVISSEGEVVVFKGTDPTSASSWAIVGVYYVGKPLGQRCFTKLAGDVSLMTENGVFPLSRILQTGSVNFASAMTNKIQPTFTEATADTGITATGWECCVYPQWDALIMNVPAGLLNTAIRQYVMNTTTGALCSFSGWNANCFEVYEGQLYFGAAGGVVYKAWDTANALTSDSLADIVATAHCAWSDFGLANVLKVVTLFRLLLAYNATVEVRWNISPDYRNVPLASRIPRAASSSGSPWDTSPWDTSSWATDPQRYADWKGVNHFPGYALALWLQTANNGGTLSWAGTDFIVERGGVM